MSKYTTIFSSYGGKGKIAHLYPPPRYGLIIEPFAGAAGYSLRYCDRDCVIADYDDKIADIWRFLLYYTRNYQCVADIPTTVETGTIVTSLPHADIPGLLEIYRAAANAGTQGATGVHNQVTKFGSKAWPRLRDKLLYWMPKIGHWRFYHLPYDKMSIICPGEATWFIDPPYSHAAGQRYRTKVSDYERLAAWVQSLKGQVIVCGNTSETWLSFSPLTKRRGIYSSYQRSEAEEGVWTNDTHQGTDMPSLRPVAQPEMDSGLVPLLLSGA